MQFKAKDSLVDLYRAYSPCVSILLNLIYLIYIIVYNIVCIILRDYTKTNSIAILINVLKDILIYFNISINLYINISVVFDR